MSQAKHHDSALVRLMLNEAVRWWKEARLHPENAERDEYELARECANGSFQRHVWSIPEARKEIVARKFMEACRERFATEVPKALAETKESEAELVY